MLGGTAAKVTVMKHPMGITGFYQLASNSVSGTYRYYSEAPAKFSCNFNGLSVWTSLYGITLSSQIPADNLGVLNLSDSLLPTTITGITGVGMTASTASVYSPAYLPVDDQYTDHFIDDITNSDVVIDGRSVRNQGHRVQIGATGTANAIPTINILSPGNYTSWMPWALEFAGNADVTTINNYGMGWIRSSADSLPTQTARIINCYLSNHAVLDLAGENPYFDDWRIGGITGGQIYGGIIFLTDNTARVRSSQNVRFFNTKITPTGANARVSDGFVGEAPTVLD
jgi:hypothetical protein